jgi:hypothetical protein
MTINTVEEQRAVWGVFGPTYLFAFDRPWNGDAKNAKNFENRSTLGPEMAPDINIQKYRYRFIPRFLAATRIKIQL